MSALTWLGLSLGVTVVLTSIPVPAPACDGGMVTWVAWGSALPGHPYDIGVAARPRRLDRRPYVGREAPNGLLDQVLDGVSLLVMVFTGLVSGGSNQDPNGRMNERQRSLVGKWRKASTAKCAESYPDEIEFFEATYLGKKGQSGQRFIVWDAGGYQVTQADRVKIDIATDEQVSYSFSVSGSVLRFVDPDGCEFEYRRA